MSNAVFPVLPGLTYDVTRTPTWSTTTKKATSMRSYRQANASYPIYHYKLSYDVLRQTIGFSEMSTLAGFFNARQGGFDSFLLIDPDDNTVTLQAAGVGDGSTVAFQLVRTFGGFVEPVFDLNGTPSIYVNGVLRTAGTDYTISATGVVTFTVAPGAGLTVAWSGSFYRRVVFSQDLAEFNKFMQGLWELKSIELEGVRP